MVTLQTIAWRFFYKIIVLEPIESSQYQRTQYQKFVCQKQRQRELDSFQNQKKPSYKNWREMEKPHMDQLKKIFKGKWVIQKESFWTLKVPTQNIVLKHDISKDYRLLLSKIFQTYD